MIASHFDHPRFDWMAKKMGAIASVVFSGIPDPNRYLATLPEGDQCVFYVGKLIQIVYNGGVHEYLSGCYADDVNHCIHYLKEVGALEVADSLSRLESLLPVGYLDQGREATDKALFALCDKHSVKRLDDLVFVDVDRIDLEEVYRYATSS